MKQQTITKDGIQAIRLTELENDLTIQNHLPVRILPELQAVAYNTRLSKQKIIKWWQLPRPEAIEGLRTPANYYSEVWLADDGKGELLLERWYFTGISEANAIKGFIEGFREEERRQAIKLCKAKLRPEPFTKSDTGKSIDPFKQAVAVTRRMLQEEYHYLAKHQTPADLMFDTIRQHGWAEGSLNLGDPATVEKLSEAHQTYARRTKRKTVYDAADYYLAHPKVWPDLCRLKPEEISARVESATQIKLKPEAIQQRISRLGLVTALKRGKRQS